MIRRERCQSWIHLRLLGLPKPLVWPEPAGASVKWRRGGVSVLGTGAAWQVVGCSLLSSARFQNGFCCCCSDSALCSETPFHWEVADWFQQQVSVKVYRIILLGILSIQPFFLFPKSLMSLNIINRFVVKKLVTFDSGDESPDISETFNCITDASLVLRFKNVALI